MKKKLMSNQLDWIAESIQYWTFKTQKGIYTEKNLWRIRDLAQKKLHDLYLHIHKVKNQLDMDLNKVNRNKRIHRETMNTIKEYDEIYGKDAWYKDYKNRKPIPKK